MREWSGVKRHVIEDGIKAIIPISGFTRVCFGEAYEKSPKFEQNISARQVWQIEDNTPKDSEKV